ncbi:MAG: hypothetical protein VW443_02290 [Pseudomonadales bacterium]
MVENVRKLLQDFVDYSSDVLLSKDDRWEMYNKADKYAADVLEYWDDDMSLVLYRKTN